MFEETVAVQATSWMVPLPIVLIMWNAARIRSFFHGGEVFTSSAQRLQFACSFYQQFWGNPTKSIFVAHSKWSGSQMFGLSSLISLWRCFTAFWLNSQKDSETAPSNPTQERIDMNTEKNWGPPFVALLFSCSVFTDLIQVTSESTAGNSPAIHSKANMQKILSASSREAENSAHLGLK